MSQATNPQGLNRARVWLVLSSVSILSFVLGWQKSRGSRQNDGVSDEDAVVRKAPVEASAQPAGGEPRADTSGNGQPDVPIGTLLEKIQRILAVSAGAVGVIYILGFVIVNFYLGWAHDFFEPTLLRVRYLSAGLFYAFYTFFVFAWLLVSIGVSQQPFLARSRWRQLVWFVCSFLALLTLGFFFSSIIPARLAAAVDVQDPFPWWKPVTFLTTRGFSLGESALGVGYYYGDTDLVNSGYIALSYILYFPGAWMVYGAIQRLTDKRAQRQFRPWVGIVSVIAVPLLLVLYSVLLYPNLVAAVGGGSPHTVQLLMKPEQLDETVALSIGRVSSSKTVPVSLVDQTPDFYVIEGAVPDMSVLQLPRDAVVGVAYLDTGSATQSDAYVAKGWEEYQEGNYDEALRLTGEALEANAWNPWAYIERGWIYRKLDKRSEAIGSYAMGTRLLPSHVWTYLDLGQLLQQDGKLDAASSAYESSLATAESLDPTMIGDAYIGLGEVSLAKLDLQTAIQYLERAHELDRQDDRGSYLLIHAYLADATRSLLEGDFSAAQDRYGSALSIEPEEPLIRVSSAMAHLAYGEPRIALARIERLVEDYPHSSRPYLDRALAFSKLGRPDLALADWERAVELVPDLADAVERFTTFPSDMRSPKDLTRRGVIRAYIGDWLGAFEDLDRAIEENAEDPWAYVNRAFVYDHLELRQRAKEDFDAAIALLGRDPLVAIPLVGRGNVYNAVGVLSWAQTDYELAAEYLPGLSWPHYQLGWLHNAEGRFERANSEFDQASDLLEFPDSLEPLISDHQLFDPFQLDLARVYWAKAFVYNRQDKRDTAIDYLKKAIESNPDRSTYYSDLAEHYEAVYDVDAALAVYEDAIARWPDLPRFHQELGMLQAREESWEEAELQFTEAIQLYEDYAPAHFHLGNLYKATEKPAEAAKAYQACIETGYSQAWRDTCLRALEELENED